MSKRAECRNRGRIKPGMRRISGTKNARKLMSLAYVLYVAQYRASLVKSASEEEVRFYGV